MSDYFEGMNIGVDSHGIADFNSISLDGVNYQRHGDSNLNGAPVIDGFGFALETQRNKYVGSITLQPSPYVEYETKAVDYLMKADVDFPITHEVITDSGLEWLDSRELPVTTEERNDATMWLLGQTKFSVLDWFFHFHGDQKGADLIKWEMAQYLGNLPNRVITVHGTTQDGQVKNYMATLTIKKNDEPEQVIQIREVVLDKGITYLLVS